MTQNLTDHTDFFPYSRKVKHTHKRTCLLSLGHIAAAKHIQQNEEYQGYGRVLIYSICYYAYQSDTQIYWILCYVYLNQAFEEMSERQKTFQAQCHCEASPLIIFCIFTYPVIRHMNTCLVQFSSGVSDSLQPPGLAARQASLFITNSWSLLKLMSIESVMPSNHLILCCPLSSCLQSFPASGESVHFSNMCYLLVHQSFTGGSGCKTSAYNVGDLGLIPGSGRSPGEGNGNPLQYSCLDNPMDTGAWQAAVHGVAKSRTGLSDFTFTFYFHALEKEMATHSSVLAWRIPATGEPGGLPSMGSHRVGHD